MPRKKKDQPDDRALTLPGGDVPAAPPPEMPEFTYGKFHFTPNGMTVLPGEEDPSLAEFGDMMHVQSVTHEGGPFIVGDLIVYGEGKYGDQASQYIDARGWSLGTIKVYTWLAKSVPASVRRMDRLTIRHHIAVAALPVEDTEDGPGQRTWLTKAANDGEDKPWTVKQLTEAIMAGTALVETGWGVVVSCTSHNDMLTYRHQQELSGRECKEVVKHKPGPKPVDDQPKLLPDADETEEEDGDAAGA